MKLLLAERDGFIAQAVWDDSDTVVSSQVAYPECCSAVSAALRARRIGTRAARRAREQLEDVWQQIVAVEVEASLARVAGRLAETHRLRALDALHLASALVVENPDIVVLSWDRDLRTASLAEGLAVMPVTV